MLSDSRTTYSRLTIRLLSLCLCTPNKHFHSISYTFLNCSHIIVAWQVEEEATVWKRKRERQREIFLPLSPYRNVHNGSGWVRVTQGDWVSFVGGRDPALWAVIFSPLGVCINKKLKLNVGLGFKVRYSGKRFKHCRQYLKHFAKHIDPIHLFWGQHVFFFKSRHTFSYTHFLLFFF